MKILLTGATGYLGSKIVNHCVKNKIEVVILKRSSSSMLRLKSIKTKIYSYNLDKIHLSKPFIQKGPFDAVIHTATCYGKNNEEKKEIFEANIKFPTRLLKLSVKFKTKIFINTDTYYSKAKKIPKNLFNYTLSKKKFLKIIKLYAKTKKIKVANLRLEHVYGPGDAKTKFVNWLIRSLFKKNRNIKLTEGKQKKDMIFIDDVINAYHIILKNISKIKKHFVNIEVGTGKSLSIFEFVNLAHKLSKSKNKLKFGCIPYQKNEIMFSRADVKFLKNLNWNYKVNVINGLKKLLRFNYF